jgi:hypothetical protein
MPKASGFAYIQKALKIQMMAAIGHKTKKYIQKVVVLSEKHYL